MANPQRTLDRVLEAIGVTDLTYEQRMKARSVLTADLAAEWSDGSFRGYSRGYTTGYNTAADDYDAVYGDLSYYGYTGDDYYA